MHFAFISWIAVFSLTCECFKQFQNKSASVSRISREKGNVQARSESFIFLLRCAPWLNRPQPLIAQTEAFIFLPRVSKSKEASHCRYRFLSWLRFIVSYSRKILVSGRGVQYSNCPCIISSFPSISSGQLFIRPLRCVHPICLFYWHCISTF